MCSNAPADVSCWDESFRLFDVWEAEIDDRLAALAGPSGQAFQAAAGRAKTRDELRRRHARTRGSGGRQARRDAAGTGVSDDAKSAANVLPRGRTPTDQRRALVIGERVAERAIIIDCPTIQSHRMPR